ncbi:HlyC/CorC family transporter [Candidatus Azambacteria bacterium]|nr:HlyC/CorC family transporter [Candidatus Azambacteria bacterium]
MIEAALFAVNLRRAQILREQKKMGAEALVKIKERMGRPITVLVVFNNVVSIVGSMFVGAVAAETLGGAWLGYMSAIITFLIIIFGEIIPKTFGENYAEKISLLTARPLLFMARIFSPIIWLLEKLTSGFSKDKKSVSEDDLKILSKLGYMEGSIEEDEMDIIQKVFTLNDIRAKDIMVPRVLVMALPADKALEEIKDEIYNFPNSRFPIYSGSIDNVIGVCHRQDLLVALGRGRGDVRVKDFAIPPIFVNENTKADELLPLFQKKRFHLAVVRDHFGGTAGIVTLEDVLEQLVGDIVDEKDEFINLRKRALGGISKPKKQKTKPEEK